MKIAKKTPLRKGEEIVMSRLKVSKIDKSIPLFIPILLWPFLINSTILCNRLF